MLNLRNFLTLPLVVTLAAISAEAGANTLINGAGATFPQPIYSKWFAEYASVNKAASINYQAIGSGGGIRQLIQGTVDFGATDEPMSAEEAGKVKTPVLHVPTVLGAVAVSYNVPGVKSLNLTGEMVAEIFMGTIKKWNDPKIVAANKDAKLPDLAIVPTYRSDGSGTTAVFTDYLVKASKGFEIKVGKGKAVMWPAGIGAKGNAGVAGVIAQNPGAVGYVELVFAATNNLAVASIQNKSGEFVAPSTASVSAAATGRVPEMLKNDFKVSITDPTTKGAYPISSFTWLLIPNEMSKVKGSAMIAFVDWALGATGQKMAADLNYAPLPKELATEVVARVKKLQLK